MVKKIVFINLFLITLFVFEAFISLSLASCKIDVEQLFPVDKCVDKDDMYHACMQANVNTPDITIQKHEKNFEYYVSNALYKWTTNAFYYAKNVFETWGGRSGKNLFVFSPKVDNTLQDQLARELGLSDISVKGVFSTANLNKIVQIVLLIGLSLLGVFFIIMLITAGIKFMSAGEDENKRKSAIKRIMSAIIGIIIVLASFLILSIFFSFFGISPFKKEQLIPVECSGLSGEALDRCKELFEQQ